MSSRSDGHETTHKRPRDCSATPEKKKKIRGESQFTDRKRTQNYRTEWQDDVKFKNWLRPVEKLPARAQCVLCNTQFVADISVIKTHAAGIKHKANVKGVGFGNNSIKDTFTRLNLRQKSDLDLELESCVKVAEMKICGYVASQNLALRQVDNITNVCKSAFTDSKIVKTMKLGRTKATNVICKVIGKCHLEELIETFKSTKFSIIIDEGTDIASLKTLAVCVRYFDEQTKSISTKFWRLIQIFDGKDPSGAEAGATAERLYDKLIESFQEAKIPTSNIIGFASDGCNVMFGEKNSVASRMKKLQDGIVVMKCICHSLHLCASEACKMLPKHCEDLARNIYTFFNHSSKRQAAFQQFQDFCEIEPHKLLRPAQTRWLSLLQVVRRILEQWTALRLYFTDQWQMERLAAAEMLYKELNDDWLNLYYLFMDWVLPKVVKLNEYFQSEKVVITDMHSKMIELLTELLSAYMNPQTIKRMSLDAINPNDVSLFIPLNQIYLGVNVLKKLQEKHIQAEVAKIEDFLHRCRMFIITLCEQILKRYDFSSSNVASRLAWFSPQNALSFSPTRPHSISSLVQQLPCIVAIANNDLMQKIDDEWQKLPFASFPTEWLNDSVDKTWARVRDSIDMSGEKQFGAIGQFALNLLVLPHSSASCERIFSKINLIKTKSRNKLITDTLNGLILTSQYVQANGGNQFEPSKKMVQSMTTSNLYPTKKKSEQKSSLPNIVDEEKENVVYSEQDDPDIEIEFN